MNNDKFYNLTAESNQVAAFTVLTGLDGSLKDEEMVAGIATFLLMLCARYNLDVRDVLSVTHKRTKDGFSEGRGEHIRAIQEYMRGELQ
jgi:hypothetical protein